MARGNSKLSVKGKALYAKIAGLKEGEQVRFDITKKDDNGTGYVSDGSEKVLSGHLVGAYHDTWTYQGTLKDKCKLVLNDPQAGSEGETYYVEFSPATAIGRNIINALLGASNFLSVMKFSLYNNKENGRASIGMYLGNERMNWKYSIDELSKYITETTEKVKDASGKVTTVKKKNLVELNEFFLNEFKEKVVKYFDNAPQVRVEAQDQSETQVAAAPVGEDDLPF